MRNPTSRTATPHREKTSHESRGTPREKTLEEQAARFGRRKSRSKTSGVSVVQKGDSGGGVSEGSRSPHGAPADEGYRRKDERRRRDLGRKPEEKSRDTKPSTSGRPDENLDSAHREKCPWRRARRRLTLTQFQHGKAKLGRAFISRLERWIVEGDTRNPNTIHQLSNPKIKHENGDSDPKPQDQERHKFRFFNRNPP
jgi:hypothetical protein